MRRPRSASRAWSRWHWLATRCCDRTNNDVTPWFVVRADNKREARLNVIRHILARVDCPEQDQHVATPDEEIVFPYRESSASEGRLTA